MEDVQKTEVNPKKLESLQKMEESGGEPDVVGFENGEFLFYDCSVESPKERRIFFYDQEALDKRKENKPKNSATEFAKSMGIEILNEEECCLQTLHEFDYKTSLAEKRLKKSEN